MWSGVNDITELPKVQVDRLRHYFSIYKALTPEEAVEIKIDAAYGREHALKVVEAAMADYVEEFGE
jgi:inorganic pyrophosphatase